MAASAPAAAEPDAAAKQQLVREVRAMLAADASVPDVGEGGDATVAWFLRDRRWDPTAATTKLAKMLRWRRDFGVASITPEAIAQESATGKAFLHTHKDVQGRPVVVVDAAKHFPSEERFDASCRLCAYLVENAIAQLPPGKEQFLGIFALKGFAPGNADWAFVKFLINIFFDYYPKRLGQVLFVDAPLIFRTGFAMVKPMLKSYATLVRFCSTEELRREYFTPDTVPDLFR